MTEKVTAPQSAVEYSEGICGDGVAILRNGQPMSISEILAALNDTRPPRLQQVATIDHVGVRWRHLNCPMAPQWNLAREIPTSGDHIEWHHVYTADAIRVAEQRAYAECAQICDQIAQDDVWSDAVDCAQFIRDAAIKAKMEVG